MVMKGSRGGRRRKPAIGLRASLRRALRSLEELRRVAQTLASGGAWKCEATLFRAVAEKITDVLGHPNSVLLLRDRTKPLLDMLEDLSFKCESHEHARGIALDWLRDRIRAAARDLAALERCILAAERAEKLTALDGGLRDAAPVIELGGPVAALLAEPVAGPSDADGHGNGRGGVTPVDLAEP